MTHPGVNVSTPWRRIHLADIRRALGVELKEVARAAGLSVTAAQNLELYALLPKRADLQAVQRAVHDLMVCKGATREQLRRLFQQAPPATPAHWGARAQREEEKAQRRQARLSAARRPVFVENDVLIAKQILTPAAARHFKLFRNPFDGPVERDEQLFVSDDIAYLRETLWQGAMHGSFMALIGESGSGKTTLLGDLEDRLTRESRHIVVIKPSTVGMEESASQGHMIKSADLLRAVITRLNRSVPVPQTLQARTELAMRLLAESVRAGNVHVLAVEEAHRMPEATLRHLKRLHEMRESRRPLLGIVLLAQPELQRRLDEGLRSGSLREVAQRCEVVTVPALGQDLGGYLHCRVKAYGRKLDDIAEPEALQALGERLALRSGADIVPMSYPLAANNFVTRSMNLAASIGVARVTADVVRAA